MKFGKGAVPRVTELLLFFSGKTFLCQKPKKVSSFTGFPELVSMQVRITAELCGETGSACRHPATKSKAEGSCFAYKWLQVAFPVLAVCIVLHAFKCVLWSYTVYFSIPAPLQAKLAVWLLR